MKNWKHITFEQRKIISSLLTKRYKLVEIADLLELDPTSISKEIKRNRIVDNKSKRVTDQRCKLTDRFPFTCNGCHKKYSSCPFLQFKYIASSAQSKADERLVKSRVGINMSESEFAEMDRIIKEGIDNKESIYHIVKSNPGITPSVPTVYRLINERKLTTKRMDLPYAVTYKKRKVSPQYEYKENSKIDRSKRTYIDYLDYIHNHRNVFPVQMDFLGSIRSDKKSILTMTIPDLHYVMLFIIESPNQTKVHSVLNKLEQALGNADFTRVFPLILTDRDPCFSDFDSIETSFELSTERTRIFYCDSFNSSQKANVEQINKQLRKFFPKGKTIDHHTSETVREIGSIINKSRIQSLAGFTPNEAFEKIYGETILSQLTSILV